MAQISEPRRFPDTRLPAVAFDGSHLKWRTFRWNVLAPYRIRILDSVPEDRSPTEVLEKVDGEGNDLARHEAQCARFKAQLPLGRGFGPSPLFPPNLLPSTDCEALLTRCMLPKCPRDILPERANCQQGSVYELPLPRPSFASGYSLEAFTVSERNELPQSLVTGGTVVHYSTGYVSPGVPVVAPFLTFERSKGTGEEEVEGAMNRCALNGSWCIRATQQFYNKAYQGFVIPELPTAFSCTIDNNFAILNYHWIDHGEEYYMAPLKRFNFEEEEALPKFVACIQAIESWALNQRLTRIKAAIEKLGLQLTTPPMTPDSQEKTPVHHFDPAGSDAIMKALKTTFSNVPWRMDEDDRTPMPMSAMKSPLGRRKSFFDFASVNVSSPRTAIANHSVTRHRRSDSISSDTATVTSPISPMSAKRPPIASSNRPTVPVIRVPASPKDRQTPPSSPAPNQLQQQLLVLTQEVQSLRKEVQELKTLSGNVAALTDAYNSVASPTKTYPSPPPPPPLPVPQTNEAGLPPIPEESCTTITPTKEVRCVTTTTQTPLITETVVTVTEVLTDENDVSSSLYQHKHQRPNQHQVQNSAPNQSQSQPQHHQHQRYSQQSLFQPVSPCSTIVSFFDNSRDSPRDDEDEQYEQYGDDDDEDTFHAEDHDSEYNTTPKRSSFKTARSNTTNLSKMPRISFWQVAASLYLTVLVGKMLVNDEVRVAVGKVLFP